MSDDDTILNTSVLDKIIRALKKGGNAGVNIGIFGKNATRSNGTGDNGEALNNATIGAFAEFGTTKSPQRSFLKMPISEYLGKELERSGAFDEKTLAKVVKEGSMRAWLEKVAFTAENVVQDAFNTGGFGRWLPSIMTGKKNHQTLVETQQLRNSITTEIIGID